MIESGTLLQDRYLIERQIGEGGMGAVYVAIDQRFGSQVAIKETFYKDDELGAAFEREARLLNSLHHPVLPHVSDYFAENNGYFLVMQFIEGEDLFEVLKRDGAFPVKDVVRWTDSLLDALDYLHSQEPPIIHRDIKPQNLKITPRGDIILLDFGLAKLKSEDTTGVKSIFGYSRKYSPLEQIQGTGTDVRSDIFSLAATAYHLMTGKPPVEVIARASAIIHGDADPLRLASDINSEIPVGVANVLNSALALNAARRFASAKAMRQALEHAVNSAVAMESANESPAAILPVVAETDFEVVNAAEIENFTALEAFAADVINNSPDKSEGKNLPALAIPISSPISNQVISPETSKNIPQKSYIGGDLETKVAKRSNNLPRFRFAALTALLICGALAGLYFIARTDSSSKSNQTPQIETRVESNVDANSSSPILDAQEAQVTDVSLTENAEQTKTKSVSPEKAIKKKETVELPVIEVGTSSEKPKTESPTIEIPHSSPVKTARRAEPKPSREPSRPRVAVDEPAPDIESIFTGSPSTRRIDEKERRREMKRQQRDQMTEEDWREMRRQRRQERKARQNGYVIPF
jgi:serine/threonine protein kinase